MIIPQFGAGLASGSQKPANILCLDGHDLTAMCEGGSSCLPDLRVLSVCESCGSSGGPLFGFDLSVLDPSLDGPLISVCLGCVSSLTEGLS